SNNGGLVLACYRMQPTHCGHALRVDNPQDFEGPHYGFHGRVAGCGRNAAGIPLSFPSLIRRHGVMANAFRLRSSLDRAVNGQLLPTEAHRFPPAWPASWTPPA